MPRVMLVSSHSKNECRSRLAASFDVRMTFRWLTWSNVSPKWRLMGRIDGDDARAVIIRPGPGVVLRLPSRIRALPLFRSGFQVLTARMAARPDGTAILAEVGQPLGDIAILSVGVSIILALIEANLLFLAVAPPAFAFFVFFNAEFRRARLEADANELIGRVCVALDARPVRPRARVPGGTSGPQGPSGRTVAHGPKHASG